MIDTILRIARYFYFFDKNPQHHITKSQADCLFYTFLIGLPVFIALGFFISSFFNLITPAVICLGVFEFITLIYLLLELRRWFYRKNIIEKGLSESIEPPLGVDSSKITDRQYVILYGTLFCWLIACPSLITLACYLFNLKGTAVGWLLGCGLFTTVLLTIISRLCKTLKRRDI